MTTPSQCPGCNTDLHYEPVTDDNGATHWNADCNHCNVHVHVKQRDHDVPVRQGDEYDVRIISTEGGPDGVAKIGDGAPTKGFTVFVPDTVKGESVRIRIKETFERFAKAEVVKRYEKPPDA